MQTLFLLVSLVAAIGMVPCLVLVLIQMFKRGRSGLGITCLVLLCCGWGELIAFVYGWTNAKAWNIQKIMLAWTVCWAVCIVAWLMWVATAAAPFPETHPEHLKDIVVRTVRPPSEVAQPVAGVLTYGLTREDFDHLNATIPNIEVALAIRELRRQFTCGGRMADGRVVGCTPKYAEVMGLEIKAGRFVTDLDLIEKSHHCVLAAGTAESLFPYEDPLGRAIQIGDSYYVVVGVVKPWASSAVGGGLLAAQDLAHDVYFPLSTLGDLADTRRGNAFDRDTVQLSQITLRVDKVENVLKTAELVKETLRRRHKIEDYSVTVPLELVKLETVPE
jgi:putative ABC transport system permease protein